MVDGPGEHLLSRTRFTGQQYGGICHRHLPGELYRLPKCRRRADNPVEGVFLGKLVLETGESPLHLGLFGGTAEQRQYLVIVVTFGNVIKSSVLDGLHTVGNVAVSGHQDDFHRRCRLLDSAHELHAAAVRQFDIAEHHIRLVLPEHLHSRSAVRRLRDFISFESDNTRE